MPAAFHITTDPIVADPLRAQEFTRGVPYASLEETGAQQGTIATSEGYLRFPDDAVLLMIGHTPQLKEACEKAANAGIIMIGTNSDLTLRLLFVRIRITWKETDTLIAIGADRGWLPAPQRDKRRKVTGRTDTTYVTTRSQNDPVTQTRALPDMIDEIKERFNDPWIPKR
jgi:hypothetical protein